MNKNQHTQGKWEIDDTRQRTSVNCGDKHVAMVNFFDGGPNSSRTVIGEEHKANARLIGNASRMYDVLWMLAFGGDPIGAYLEAHAVLKSIGGE